jgi:predicted metalloprotease
VAVFPRSSKVGLLSESGVYCGYFKNLWRGISMFQILTICLLVVSGFLYGNNPRGLLAGDVSPSASKNSNSSSQQETPSASYSDSDEEDSEDTGEVDEDIIINDEENTNDDEGVSN